MFSSEELDEIARRHGFIKRSRKMPAFAFLEALVFSNENGGKLSLLDLTLDLAARANIKITREALHKRFTPEAVSFLQEVFSRLLSSHLETGGFEKGDYGIFSGIYIKDSTKFKIPDIFAVEYPSYGSYGQKGSLMNIQYEYELISGNCHRLELTKATANDQEESKKTIGQIKEGGLYLRDLGYVTPAYLQSFEGNNAYYLNRLPKIGVYQKGDGAFKALDWDKVDKLFRHSNLNYLELEVFIGEKQKQKTRLVITPVPQNVASRRIREAERGGERRKGYKISKEYRVKAHYNLFITNIPLGEMDAIKVIEIYRLRWQVELVFKSWKSNMDIHKCKAMNLNRFKCQLIAKLIRVLINTGLFQVANCAIRLKNRNEGCSPVKFFKWAKTLSTELRKVVKGNGRLSYVFDTYIVPVLNDFIIEKRLDKNTHCKILASIISG